MSRYCRTCLVKVEEANYLALDDKTCELLREKLEKCVPQISLHLTLNPVLCEICCTTVEKAYKFKERCKEIEDKIYTHLRKHPTIQLSDIVESRNADVHNESSKKVQELPNMQDLQTTVEIKEEKDETIVMEQKWLLDPSSPVGPKNISNNPESMVTQSDFISNDMELCITQENMQTDPLQNENTDVPMDTNGECYTGSLENCRAIFMEFFEYAQACKVCRMHFRSNSLLLEHVQPCMQKMPLHCCACNFSTTHGGDYLVHVRAHVKDKSLLYKCTECEYSTKSLDFSTKHMHNHTGERPFLCDQCGDGFTTNRELNRHRFVHRTAYVFECTKCDFETSNHNAMSRHRSLHKPPRIRKRSYKIKVPKTYTKQSKITPKVTSFMCLVCGVSFPLESNHKVDTYTCNLCDYKTCTDQLLVLHKRRHNTRTLYCTVCSFKCVGVKRLQEHMQMHSDENHFKCHLCSYKGARLVLLRSHMKRHMYQITQVEGGGSLDDLLKSANEKSAFQVSIKDENIDTGDKSEVNIIDQSVCEATSPQSDINEVKTAHLPESEVNGVFKNKSEVKSLFTDQIEVGDKKNGASHKPRQQNVFVNPFNSGNISDVKIKTTKPVSVLRPCAQKAFGTVVLRSGNGKIIKLLPLKRSNDTSAASLAGVKAVVRGKIRKQVSLLRPRKLSDVETTVSELANAAIVSEVRTVVPDIANSGDGSKVGIALSKSADNESEVTTTFAKSGDESEVRNILAQFPDDSGESEVEEEVSVGHARKNRFITGTVLLPVHLLGHEYAKVYDTEDFFA